MRHVKSIIDSLVDLITGRSDARKDRLNQGQREAIIDALLYCLYADDYDDPAERNIMDKSIARLNWESGISVTDYIEFATEKVNRALSSEESEQAFLASISERLEDWERRFQTLQLCKILFYSDMFFSDEEVRALTELSRVFKRR